MRKKSLFIIVSAFISASLARSAMMHTDFVEISTKGFLVGDIRFHFRFLATNRRAEHGVLRSAGVFWFLENGKR